jgi:hypothetical protein
MEVFYAYRQTDRQAGRWRGAPKGGGVAAGLYPPPNPLKPKFKETHIL